jgi:hypothetical protein
MCANRVVLRRIGAFLGPSSISQHFREILFRFLHQLWDEDFLDMRVKDLWVYRAFDAHRRANPAQTQWPDE